MTAEQPTASSRIESTARRLEDRKTKKRPIPPDLKDLREAQKQFNQANERVAAPRIELHIAASRTALDQLEAHHRYLADESDLDLTAYSRGSAVWLLSGRLLGLSEAMWVQIQAGIGSEALVMGRAIHEAARVLWAILDRNEEEILRLWLEDDGRTQYVKPKAARDAQARREAKRVEAMKRLGHEPGPRGDSASLNAELYDKLSRAAHNRRSTCIETLWEPGREMAYGRQSSVLHRAYYVGWAGQITVEVASAVGDALAAFFRDDFFAIEVQPLIDGIENVTREAPLDEESIQREAGTFDDESTGGED